MDISSLRVQVQSLLQCGLGFLVSSPYVQQVFQAQIRIGTKGVALYRAIRKYPAIAAAAREQQEKLVAAAADAARLARMQFQGGATSYLAVLTTDSTLFSAQLNLVGAREGETQSLVQLYEALGGGWK
jgi:hypothetical protein